MAVHGGTDLVTDGLTYCIDAMIPIAYPSGTTVTDLVLIFGK